MIAADEQTPVLVGVGVAGGPHDDPARAPDAIGLMIEAARAAGADAGGRSLLAAVDRLVVPQGSWRIADPAAHVAAAIGAHRAQRVLAGLGVLQHSAIADAARAIASGSCRVALVVGAEDRHRVRLAAKTGVTLPERGGLGTGEPDVVIRPDDAVLHPVELAAGLVDAVAQYALLEDACARAGWPSDLDDQWRASVRAARANPAAWRQPASDTAPRAGEPRLAGRYCRDDATQWNVDQGAALLLTSLAAARAAGVALDRMVFPLAGAESNHIVPVSARPDLATSAAVRLVGHALAEALAAPLATIELVELYSCFPVAVTIQQRALDVDPTHPHTVTGGMVLAGGPFNNYVLQATARMAELLRTQPDQRALVSCISGMLTKYGAMVWSATPSVSYSVVDVSSAVAAATTALPVAPLAAEAPPLVEAEAIVHRGPLAGQRVALGRSRGGMRVLAVEPADRPRRRALR